MVGSTLVDWYPQSTPEQIVAVGHPNGHVTVTGLHPGISSSGGLFGKREFSPRTPRPCSQVKWNPSRHNLLAVGLDRAQREPSLLIWDVSTRLVSHSLGPKKSTSVHGQESYFRHGGRPQPMAQPHGTARTAGPTELALGDGVLSLAWVPDKSVAPFFCSRFSDASLFQALAFA